jgi:hypothetical protein
MKLYSPVTLVIKIAMHLHPSGQKAVSPNPIFYKKYEFMLDRVTFDTVC